MWRRLDKRSAGTKFALLGLARNASGYSPLKKTIAMEPLSNSEDDKQSPGAGGGMTNDFAAGEAEKGAARKNAGHPGFGENAAGMHGRDAGDKDKNDAGKIQDNETPI